MKSFDKALNVADKISVFLASVALGITFLLTAINVIMRYIFRSGFSWSEEGARYGLILLIIFGVVETSHHRDHFRLEILADHLHGLPRRIVDVLVDLLTLGVSLTLLIGGYKMMILNLHNTTPAMRIPAWLPYGALVFSMFFAILHDILYLLNDLVFAKKTEKEGC